MALFYECMLKCARKLLDTADIVREAIYRQLTHRSVVKHSYSGGRRAAEDHQPGLEWRAYEECCRRGRPSH
jgi:hypothetical protein